MRVLQYFKKLNYPIIIGFCIIILLSMVSFFPERFADSDPYAKETLRYEENGSRFLIPPVPPGVDYKWGTDEKGRDLRSLIIYGSRATLFMAFTVALGRLLIAFPLAFAAAYKNKPVAWTINIFNSVFSAIPLVMIILLLSRISLFTDFLTNPMSVATFIMTVFGWSKLTRLLTKSVENVLNEDFIEGEIAIGKTKLGIAIQNVIPHIIPSVVVLFFLEVASVLLLLAQVGVLGLLLSVGYVDGEFGNLNVPYEFDWASLLIFSNYLFNTGKTWLIVYPAAAFAMSIISFNLLGEGLRMEFEKRDSRVITFIKSIPDYLSPMKLIYEIKSFKTNKKAVYSKLLLVFMAILVVFFPHPRSKNPFNSVEAFATVRETGSSQFMYKEYGVSRNLLAIGYISDKLEEYGIQPFDSKYIHEMVTEEIPQIIKSDISYSTSDGVTKQLTYNKDYILAEPISAEGTYGIVYIDTKRLKDFDAFAAIAAECKDKVLLVDAKGMEYRDINSLGYSIKSFLKPKGVIFIEDWNSSEGRGNEPVYIREMGDIFSILISADQGEELLKNKNIQISVNIGMEIKKNILYANVIGVIPGKDEALKDDIILIGSSISDITDNMSKGTHEALKTGGIATELQLAKMLAAAPAKPDRTVIFAFWDDSIRFNKGAKNFSDKYIDRKSSNIFYIDIGSLDGDKLIVDSSGIKPKNKKGQSYVRDLKASLKNNDIDAVFRSISNSSIDTFTSSKQEVLAFDSANPNYLIETRKKLKSATINREDLIRFHKIGQMITDTVFDIIYDDRKD